MNVCKTGKLLAGTGLSDITPPPDCTLAGFAARDHRAEGIHDRLTATALALQKDEETAVIVALDLVSLSRNHIDYLLKRLEASYGLKPRQILINCSHTHAGPVTDISEFDLSMNELCPYRGDPDYLDSLGENILKAVAAALDSIEPAVAYWGLGETHIGISRRASNTSLYKGPASGDFGIYANYPNPRMEIDRTCPVMLIRNADGAPRALVFGAPCHPTTMSYDNYLVSAEYPGEARRALKEYYGGIPALFLQGIGGDIKPRQVAGETKFRSGTYDDVALVGKELASDIIRIIDRGLVPLDIRLKSSLKHVPVPLAKGWDERTYRRFNGRKEPEHRRYWANWWLGKIVRGEEIPETVDVTLALMELAPDLRFAGVSGELLTGMGLKIKRHFTTGITLPLGYTNGVVAYIPDSDVLEEGGYEAVESIFFSESMPAPWRKDIDSTILGAFDTLADELE
ncbi:neutral/alkaline non-lysosomal ceramidase N-terminal domain-containing protein [bacterium]|nr:neutral/alkaline non-lysosomal ceramidase N-terminal domain-containing protein [bacterium]